MGFHEQQWLFSIFLMLKDNKIDNLLSMKPKHSQSVQTVKCNFAQIYLSRWKCASALNFVVVNFII